MKKLRAEKVKTQKLNNKESKHHKKRHNHEYIYHRKSMHGLLLPEVRVDTKNVRRNNDRQFNKRCTFLFNVEVTCKPGLQKLSAEKEKKNYRN
jgi:hypothetical protein